MAIPAPIAKPTSPKKNTSESEMHMLRAASTYALLAICLKCPAFVSA